MTFTSANFTQIVAKGKITSETPDHFRVFLKSQNKLGQPWQATIRLTSGGGNVSAGFELGRLIRAHQISVVAVDFCASSCVFVMMGGLNRAVEGEAKIGVHQFYIPRAIQDPTKQQFTGEDLIAMQRLNGRLQDYAQEMGVDAGIIALASKTEPKSMSFLNHLQLKSLNMIYETPITKELADLNLLEEIIICKKRPYPYNEINRLQALGIIKQKYFHVFNNVSYFEVIKPMDVFGLKVIAIAAWDQDNSNTKNFVEQYVMSPGTLFGVIVSQSETKTEEILKKLNIIKPVKGYSTKPSIYDISNGVMYFPKKLQSHHLTEISCNSSWHF